MVALRNHPIFPYEPMCDDLPMSYRVYASDNLSPFADHGKCEEHRMRCHACVFGIDIINGFDTLKERKTKLLEGLEGNLISSKTELFERYRCYYACATYRFCREDGIVYTSVYITHRLCTIEGELIFLRVPKMLRRGAIRIDDIDNCAFFTFLCTFAMNEENETT